MAYICFFNYLKLKIVKEKTTLEFHEILQNFLKIFQKHINETLERLDYKIKLYGEIEDGKRKDFFRRIIFYTKEILRKIMLRLSFMLHFW